MSLNSGDQENWVIQQTPERIRRLGQYAVIVKN